MGRPSVIQDLAELQRLLSPSAPAQPRREPKLNGRRRPPEFTGDHWPTIGKPQRFTPGTTAAPPKTGRVPLNVLMRDAQAAFRVDPTYAEQMLRAAARILEPDET